MSSPTEELPAVVPFLKRENGKPYLAGSKCGACGQVFASERTNCAKCSARGQMQAHRLAETGKVYVFTIVHRSFPGVETPFVDVIVDLDDGAHLKGTLLNVKPDPEAIPFGLPVKIVYREAKLVNKPDTPYLIYAFEPI
jgi:uncharacterized protein